jgi:heme exporter protein A
MGLRAHGLHFRYLRRHPILREVSLTLEPGQCLVLFGANGAGKSTLLGVLSTRLRPQRGAWSLQDIKGMDDPEEARRHLLLIGHLTHLYGHLTPLENLRFFAHLRGMDPSPEALLNTVAQAGLERHAHRPTAGFSAGMKRRLALARIGLAKPTLLLLDEPYSALDAAGILWLNGLLNDYLTRGGMIVMATHDPERVRALPHQPCHLHQGTLSDTPPQA